jgi:RNA polymerase II-associated factor 1
LIFHLPYFFFSHRANFQNEAVDVSREAQLASIESSFAAARSAEQLGSLRHPIKPRLRAVAAYEVLPDADVWANAYDLFRFSERPGERGPEVRFTVIHFLPSVR